MSDARAIRALEDVAAVERVAPGMVRVVTFSDAHVVDARDGGCACPDKQYNLGPSGRCKHEHAAMLADSPMPAPWDVAEDLSADNRDKMMLLADGGNTMWTVIDHDNDNEQTAETRSEAEQKAETAREFGSENVEIIPPGDDAKTDGGDAEVVDVPTESPEEVLNDADGIPESPSVADDPVDWVPSHFVDTIDGTPAINRKGYAVLAEQYDISVPGDRREFVTFPSESDFEFAEVEAVAVTDDGKEYPGFGSAHVDRGDDETLLGELAETRAIKRALALATGVGMTAVEELKAEL